jgi:hypothetical protein
LSNVVSIRIVVVYPFRIGSSILSVAVTLSADIRSFFFE